MTVTFMKRVTVICIKDVCNRNLAAEGVTRGCGGGCNYCPDANVTRAEMAVFLVRAFSLP